MLFFWHDVTILTYPGQTIMLFAQDKQFMYMTYLV